MTSYRGITWDHPRGRNALTAAAERVTSSTGSDLELSWEAHSLEHFESHPIDDLAARYDLIVLDHPHLGEALERHSLQPLDAIVGPELIERWSREAVGPSFDSYSADGYQWALPLDAATQVAAHKTSLVAEAPSTWDEVDSLSTGLPVALSLAGPHAFLTFASICAALGEPMSDHPDQANGAGAEFVSEGTAAEVLERLRSIASRAPAGSAGQNPIALLERMSTTDDIAYCPLVYGYVNYSSPELRFADAPAAVAGGRRGSTIGGTGLAVSARCEVTPELVAHIEWLMSDDVQRSFIPQHDGQPSSRAAWLDESVDASSSGFYSGTLATIEESWVRPRYSGYITFQSAGSAIVRDVVAGELSIDGGIAALRSAFAGSVTERV